MNIPITSRVQKGGSKKACECGKTPAKMWGAAKVAYGKKSSPAKKMSCGSKKY